MRSATSRLCSTVRVTGLLDWLQRTSHFFSLFMRTWKGVLTIRSPLSTSPAIRETDGAQSFSPVVAEVSSHRAVGRMTKWSSKDVSSAIRLCPTVSTVPPPSLLGVPLLVDAPHPPMPLEPCPGWLPMPGVSSCPRLPFLWITLPDPVTADR